MKCERCALPMAPQWKVNGGPRPRKFASPRRGQLVHVHSGLVVCDDRAYVPRRAKR